jgi:hypothetical protein
MKERSKINVIPMNSRLNSDANHFLAFLARTLLFLISTLSTSLPRPASIAWIILGFSATKVYKYLPLLILNFVSFEFFLTKTAV